MDFYLNKKNLLLLKTLTKIKLKIKDSNSCI